MAEHESLKKHEPEEGVQRRKSGQELAREKLKERDTEPQAKDMDMAALESHAFLLNDSRLAHPANAGQRAEILSDLQRSYGNAYVQRLLKSHAVQAKLTVNPPDDQYEKEADRVAEAVTKASSSDMQRKPEEEEELQAKAAGSRDGLELQRQEEEEEEEEEVQAKADSSSAPEVSGELEDRIKGAEGKGDSLPESVRDSLEPHFGHDLGSVRVHTDSEADAMSEQLGARAFTHGSDIYFREGDYQPQTEEGKRLLSHEMAHVVQQGAAPISMKAASTEEKAPITDKDEVETDLLNARSKALADMSKANMKDLIYQVARCLDAGLDGAALDALDAVALQALGAVKKMANALEVKTSSLKLATELIDQVRLAELMGGEEKEEEKTADEALEGMLGWATARMNAAIKQLKSFPSALTAAQTIDGAALVMMLGGDASPAIGAVKTWGEMEKNI